jgi:hypothetical protein
MKLGVVRFSAKELRSIHRDHLGFLVAASHASNELRSLAVYVLFEEKMLDLNDAERWFVLIRQLTLLRFFISKILEFHELCVKYIANIRRTFPATGRALREKYRPIAQRVEKERWARKLRNKVSFHYDREHVLAGLETLPAETSLCLIVGPYNGVTAFGFAEEIVSVPIFKEAGGGDLEKGIGRASDFAFETHTAIADFVADAIIQQFESVGLFRLTEESELRDSHCAEEGSFEMPITMSPHIEH